jgi:NAD(P)-dependent dehydrogenase (short-subunit alcohol dehydrogenase family)
MSRAALEQKVAVVTGGASGIGRATAELLAARGAAVVVADIDAAGGAAVAAGILGHGGRALAVAVDLADEPQVESMVEAAQAAFGTVHVLHNNAALLAPGVMSRDTRIAELDAAVFGRVLRVNVAGGVLAVKYVLPLMLAQGAGVIVNMSSSGAVLGEPAFAMYGISKAAVTGLTRAIAAEYGRRGVRCVGIAPGVVVTEALKRSLPAEARETYLRHSLTPRLGTPQDIAALVTFLAGDEASFITGVTIAVDGGLTAHSPTLADQVVARGTARRWSDP